MHTMDVDFELLRRERKLREQGQGGQSGGDAQLEQPFKLNVQDCAGQAIFMRALHVLLSPWGWADEECAADELALLGPPGWLAPMLLLSNPYPILEPAGRYCGSSG